MDGPLRSRWLAALRPVDPWIVAFIGLGALAQLTRYLLRFPLWDDEAFLAVSYFDRNFWQMLQPLEYHQVAPLLYLWVQWSVMQLFGVNEYSLRLFSLVCGLSSLGLFGWVSGQLSRGIPRRLAVGMFCVAYPVTRYAVEAKQYAADLMVALLLTGVAIALLKRSDRRHWYGVLLVLTPLGIGLSFPAVFVAGGISLAMACAALRSKQRWAGWLAWGAYSGVVLASFAAVFHVSAAAQSADNLEYLRRCWADAFPPLVISQPWLLAKWLLVTHTSEMFSYPIGGARGASVITAVCAAVGAYQLWRQRRWEWLLMCLVPLGLNLIAAALHRYPYGAHVRFALYFAPWVCLLAGAGLTRCLWIGLRGHADARRGELLFQTRLQLVLGLLALLAPITMVRDVMHPYKTPGDRQARDLARWMWPALARDADVACTKTDLHHVFAPYTWEWGASALYLSNQRIYAGPASRRQAVMVSSNAKSPLRCVHFRNTKAHEDPQAVAAWLDHMRQYYSCESVATFPHGQTGNQYEMAQHTSVIDIYHFVPLETKIPGRTAQAGDRTETQQPSRTR